MAVEPTEEGIIAFAVTQAEAAWAESRQPYLLARFSPDLLKEGVDYRTVLGERRLKDFLMGVPGRIKVVFHPSQRAKIGLVPVGQEFEFPSETSSAQVSVTGLPHSSDRFRGSQRRHIVSQFLQLLSELDEAETTKVEIPTSILTKLMRDR